MDKNKAGFWAVLGVVVTIAIGAFILSPNMFKRYQESASEPASNSNMIDTTKQTPEAPSAGQGQSADAANAESDTVAASDATPAADSWVTPSFDVLRVEPDGSTVIAGKAEPGTTLDIMNGETVIASTQVGPSGDFAVILDTPLPAGDYQLTLRITGKYGSVRQSEEVATVSVPGNTGGELLAMVSKPGKASRIIAQPAAVPEEAVEVATASPASDDTKPPVVMTDQAAAAGAGSGSDETVVAGSGAVEAVTGLESTPAAKEGAAVESKTDMVAALKPSGDVPSVAETPALPKDSVPLATSVPEDSSETEAVKTTESAAPGEAEATVDVAIASPETAAEAAPVAIPADASVRVDAVEIEGDRIFIAGSATPGYKVQVAADGVVIGTGKADETGRFIVEATTQLAVGDHVINADLMDKAGENVLMRATVPFNRPEGEALAAVAPAEPANEASSAAATADAERMSILPDIASLSKMREEAFQALSSAQEMVSATDSPDAKAVSEAFEAAVAKLKSAAMADLPANSSDEALAIARSMRIQAEAALAMIKPNLPGAASTAIDQPDASQDTSITSDLETGNLSKLSDILMQAETALSEPADMAIATADRTGISSGQPGDPKTILQAPLASTPGAVIIRRGDTLWQISRRTYGEGVRYTTIYVANRSQIQDPNRIKPGQVFSVPENPLENAEEMHQQLLGKRKKP